MRYYATKTFKLRNDRDNFDYFCAYCGAKANQQIECEDRDATYYYSCGVCRSGRQEKNMSDEIVRLNNEITKILMKISALAINQTMVKSREYENKLRRLNQEYFGGDDADKSAVQDS